MVQTRQQTLQQTLQKQPLLISQLTATLESVWQNQLTLLPYRIPEDLGYVEGMLEGDRLTIQNICYQTSQFRKIHLELASVGNHLNILHCVMFPRPCFDLPIFGVDIVGSAKAISAAIVDLSPVSAADQAFSSKYTLPAGYVQGLNSLPPVRFKQPRDLPEWGSIFSDFCLFVRPTTRREESAFLDRVTQYVLLHCQFASEAKVITSADERASVLAGQRHYCSQQQKNDKTRRILVHAFGSDWAQQYLQTMLFDAP